MVDSKEYLENLLTNVGVQEVVDIIKTSFKSVNKALSSKNIEVLIGNNLRISLRNQIILLDNIKELFLEHDMSKDFISKINKLRNEVVIITNELEHDNLKVDFDSHLNIIKPLLDNL